MTSPNLFIGGAWRQGRSEHCADVIDPASGELLARWPLASRDDLDDALQAATQGFAQWQRTSVLERSNLLRRAAALLRERSDGIARAITQEQGKPLVEALHEVNGAAENVEWYAEEGRRAYGRLVPSRAPGLRQMVVMQPVGPVAAFSPWNFPVHQALRKVAAALAAGCSIVLKAPEETPSACIQAVRCFEDAGLPAGVLNLVFGVPAEVSRHLLCSPVIRKLSFTGSVRVGRELGELAGRHLLRTTMELGGHAPFIVCNDVDVPSVAALGAFFKFINAGQMCISPSRFFVERGVYEAFTAHFVEAANRLQVGNGLDPTTTMGPLANARRLQACEALVKDAVDRGARLRCGGHALERPGFFFAPTVLDEVPADSRLMTEEPFAPIAAIVPFDDLDDCIAQANALPYGLAGYGFARDAARAGRLATGLDTGMVSINQFGIGQPEVPFGGVKASGFGCEGGIEGLAAYCVPKLVSQPA